MKRIKVLSAFFLVYCILMAVGKEAEKFTNDRKAAPTRMSEKRFSRVQFAPGAVVAFPGAEGFGANSLGGRGGKVIEVTNLNDSGPGSLRACIEAYGPRICVFRTGGTIELNSSLYIKNPYMTIAGQTAPGGGITLRGPAGATSDSTLNIQTHDVVIRYLTIRKGPGGENDGLEISKQGVDKIYNVMIDHCSVSWGVDESGSTWYAPHHCSIQWSIISEGLDCSTHPKGCHSKGFMIGSYASDENKNISGAYDISFHHNLLAHNGERNPLVKTAGLADVVNNVAYNPYGDFSQVDMEHQLVKVLVNYVGNYFKSGPNTDEGVGIEADNRTGIGAGIYVEGNVVRYRNGTELMGINVVDPGARQYLVGTKFPSAPITTVSAYEAYDLVLDDAGSNKGVGSDGSFFWRRDTVDSRIVNDVENTTGMIIDDPVQVGGWPALDPGVPCQDTDHDGMPDAWEQIYGFDINNNSDNILDADGDGYTNIEEYLNGTNPLVK